MQGIFRMGDILEALSLDPANDAIRLVALAFPVFVVFLLIILLVRAKRRAAWRKGAVADALNDVSLDGHPGRAGVVAPEVAEGGARSGLHADAANAGAAIKSLEADLKAAMVSQPKTALAPIYLELARQYFAAGDERAYLEALRSAAGLAAQHGPRLAHAEARLELAEAALRAGDTTGACEQWQMARIAFEEDGQREAHDRVDRRMSEIGCPTDWVLTDF